MNVKELHAILGAEIAEGNGAAPVYIQHVVKGATLAEEVIIVGVTQPEEGVCWIIGDRKPHG